MCGHTVDREFFQRKNILAAKFLPGFIFIGITTQHYKLTPFIHRRKYFNFRIVYFRRWDQAKTFGRWRVRITEVAC